MSFPFNVRVYGLLIVDGHLLVSHETLKDFHFTKLPGGGLEFGESTRECLAREFQEETGLQVSVGDHFYTTDFFVKSAFNENHQVISIYYRVVAQDLESPVPLVSREDGQKFEWIQLEEVNESIFTFPIDKYLADRIAGLGN